MNKYLLTVCVGLSTCSVLFAQQATYSPSLDTTQAVSAPPSSIDFLKRSLGSSQVSGTASEADKAPSSASSAAKTGAPNVKSTTTATTRPTASSASKTVRSGAVLEMPLASGQVVTTRLPNKAQTTKPAKTTVPAVKSKTTIVPTTTEKAVESNNALAEAAQSSAEGAAEAAEPATSGLTPDEAAQAELDYAARMLQQAKIEANQGRFIPQAASQNAYVPSVKNTSYGYDPNEYRPGVEWQRSNSTHFVIYTQKRTSGIGSSNLSMLFETAYSTLRRHIPWMMSDKVRVFVYQDHPNYLKYEPSAKAWTRALAYPTRGEIVMYDEPGRQQELKEVFTHELVHIFTQKFFDKYQTGRLITPTWLDEGLAVYMEDQAFSGTKGGPWGHDLKRLNIQRDPKSQTADFSSSSMFSSSRSFGPGFGKKGRPVFFMPFDQFMEDSSLASLEARGKTQDWYLQAYAMVRFLLNPSGGASPSNRMQFEQFTRLISQGEQVRDPSTGFPIKDSNGKPMYRPYSTEKALARVYRYNNASSFEDAFWRWMKNQH